MESNKHEANGKPLNGVKKLEAIPFLAPPPEQLGLSRAASASSALPLSVRKRTATLNSWHSVCDLHPTAIIDDHVTKGEEVVITEKFQAPDGGWGWMCVLGCSIVHLILGGIGKSFGLIHVALTESLDASDFAVSWINSISAFVRMGMGPLSSMIHAKGYSCRQIAMTGGAMSMTAFVLASLLSSSLPALLITLGFLTGLGNSFVYTPSILIVGQYFDRHKAMANGFAVMGSGLGGFIMPIIIQMSLKHYGLHGALLILGAVAFHQCVCGALYWPLPKVKDSLMDLNNCHVSEDQKTTGDNKSIFQSMKKFFKEGLDYSLFKDSTFLLLTVTQFLAPFGIIPAVYYTPKLALTLWKDDPNLIDDKKVDAALLIAVNGIADICGRGLLGILTNFGFFRRHRAFMYAVCPLFGGIGTVMAPFVGGHGFSSLAACVAIHSFFVGGYIALTPSILSDALGREKLASSFALTLAIKGCSALIALPVAGSLVTLSITFFPDVMPYTSVYISTASMMALSTTILLSWQVKVKFCSGTNLVVAS